MVSGVGDDAPIPQRERGARECSVDHGVDVAGAVCGDAGYFASVAVCICTRDWSADKTDANELPVVVSHADAE